MNRRSYVKKVVKHLACSKARRDDYVRDLDSDIDAALESGETWAQVEQRMGDPRQIAREFNEDLSESELVAGKKRKRNKIIGIVVGVVAVIALVLAGAVWWVTPKYAPAGQSVGLSEQQVMERAQEVVTLADEGDLEALRDMSTEAVQEALSQELLDKARVATANNGNWGSFKSFGNVYAAEVDQMGVTLEVIQLVAEYENVSIVYDIVFDKDMKLATFVMK